MGAARENRKVISFCDNDYLGLSQHPRVIAAAAEAAEKYGAGAGASRLVTGDNPLNGEIERKLAAMKAMPAARLFGSGYLANIAILPVLATQGDVIILDQLAHACLFAGAKLSGALIETYRHNDMEHLSALLEQHADKRRRLVVTETIFSMDGDTAPLEAMNNLAEKNNAWLVTDDAHGFGVVKIDNPAPVQMGTLSKAVGAYGGYASGPEALMDLLISRARSFVYTTGLPPAVLGSIAESLQIIDEKSLLGDAARHHASRFAEALGLPKPAAAIVPIVIGDEKKALAASDKLFADGFLISAIRPPTVPQNTARLRFCFSATHHESDIERLIVSTKAALA